MFDKIAANHAIGAHDEGGFSGFGHVLLLCPEWAMAQHHLFDRAAAVG
jgi:hypothetical protein